MIISVTDPVRVIARDTSNGVGESLVGLPTRSASNGTAEFISGGIGRSRFFRPIVLTIIRPLEPYRETDERGGTG